MEAANDLQSETASVKFNNFDIKLFRNNDQLTIDAEHNDTLKRYSLTITSENVKDITRFLFRDVEMMYLELLEALEQKAPAGVTISITDDARIIYAQEKEVRGRKSKEDFTLWLDEEKIDREKEQEKRIDKLLKQVTQQEARIAVLEQEKKSYNERIQALEEENSNFKKLEERLTKKMQDLEGTVEQRLAKRIQTLEEENRRLDEKLTGRIQTLEGKAIPETQQMLKTTFADLERKINLMVPETEKIKTSLADFEKKTNERMQALSGELARKEFEFDPTCKRANCFSMSAGNKTITKTATDGKWIYCSAKQILSRNLQTVFSVKIDFTSKSRVIVGIFPSNLKTEDDVLTKEGTFYYYHLDTHQGIGANGKETGLNPQNSIPNATIITVNVDLAQNTINYQINGVSIATTNLEASQTSSYIYYPFVCLQDTNDKVSFM